MKRKMWTIVSFISMVVIFSSAYKTVDAAAAEEQTEDTETVAKAGAGVYSGSCGENTIWTLDMGTGVLTLDGTGVVNVCGWKEYTGDVRTVQIKAGITEIYRFFSPSLYNYDNFTEYQVETGNQTYSSIRGALLSEDGRTLISYPCGGRWYNIPDCVTKIGDNAFYKCSQLFEVSIPEGVTTIGRYAFSGCNSLDGVKIPASVTSIGSMAFWKSGIGVVEIVGKVAIMENNVFDSCYNLENVTSSSDIGEEAFYECKALKKVTLKGGVSAIGMQAFYKCTSLEDIDIADSVVEIGSGAFSKCDKLKKWHIGKGIKKLGVNPFGNCKGLESFSVDSQNKYFCEKHGVLFSKDGKKIICYPAGKRDSINYDISRGVTYLGDGAFEGCTILQEIRIPKGIAGIGTWVFEDCTSLKHIVIPEGAEMIGEGAFSGCSSLEYAVLPKTMAKIGQGMGIPVFDHCAKLQKIYGYSGTKVESYASKKFCSLDSGVALILEANGGYIPAGRKTVYPAAVYGTLPAPSRVGYTFTGWYTAKSGGEKINPDTVIREITSHTLYVHWTVNQYTVFFNGNGGAVSAGSKKVTYDSLYGALPTPKRSGYVFTGWYTSQTGGNRITNAMKVAVAGNQTLYARWKRTRIETAKITVKLTSYNSVKVSWKKINRAQGYVVYRSTTKNGSYKSIKTIKKANATFFKDTRLKTGRGYYYKVAAYKKDGKDTVYGAKSKPAGKYLKGKLAAPKQKNLTSDVLKKSFTISWKPVKSAEKIAIWRKVGNGRYKQWKVIPAKKGKATFSWARYKKGQKYSFVLKAYYVTDGVKISSGTSKPVAFKR